MKLENRAKLLLLFSHVVAITAILHSEWSWLLLSLFGWIIFIKVGGEIGLHRYLAHQSFITGRWRRRLLVTLGIFTGFASPIAWVGVHRKHHAKSDTEEDPHGCQSAWRVWSTFWKPFKIERKYYGKHILNLLREDKWILNIHHHYFKIYFITYLLIALIDWRIAAFLISVPSVYAFHCAGVGNVLCHRYGYRVYDTNDLSTNNTLMNILTMGCGLHNSHHAKPDAYDHRTYKWEIDIHAWIIKNFFMIKHGTN